MADFIPEDQREPDPDLFSPPEERVNPLWRRAAPILALAACLVLGVALYTLNLDSSGDVTTPYSQSIAASQFQRHFAPDGSLIELAADSVLEIDYTQDERRIRLLEGQAHFSVAKDASRPFVVHAGETAFRALGTAFNVKLGAQEVELLVTEGVVGVDTIAEPEAKATASSALRNPALKRLKANQKAIVSRSSSPSIAEIASIAEEELEQALQWRLEKLEFNGTTVADAVAAFNKRNRDQIRILSPEIGQERIDGAFRSDNRRGFVSLLELYGIVEFSEDESGTILLKPASSAK